MVVGKIGKRVLDSFNQKNGTRANSVAGVDTNASAIASATGITDGVDSVTTSEEPEFASNIRDPGDRDILLGRGRTSWGHTGNQEFRYFVGAYLKTYTESKNRNEKTHTVHLIYDEIIKSGGRFLKLDCATNTWYQVGKNVAREKIAHALRDAIGLRIKLTSTDGDDSSDGPRFGGGSAVQSQVVEQAPVREPSLSGGSVSRKAPLCRDVLSSEKPTKETTPPKIVIPLDQKAKSSGEIKRSREIPRKKTDQPSGRASCKTGSAISDPSLSTPLSSAFATTPHPSVVVELQRGGDEKSLHHLVDFMLSEIEQSRDDSNLIDEFDGTSAATSTDMHDEFSTGFSTMSLETPRSGISGTWSRSKGDRKEGKSTISQISDMLRSSRAPQTVRSGNFGRRPKGVVSDDLDCVQVKALYQQRSQVTCTPSFFQGEVSHESDCDVSMGGTSVEWTKAASFCDPGDVVSLDDFSLASNRSKYKALPMAEKNDQSMDSSVKSSETEKEWRSTLKALRGT
jgi:hypothetical protein